MSRTFLQLAPEFGGTRFGPFTGIVHVGSDAQRCQLTLAPNLGILPHHASIMPQPDGTYVVGPVEAQAGVFMMQGGTGQVWPVRAMVQARSGDQLIFGTPHGPRFQLQLDAGASQSGVRAAPAGGASPGGSSLAGGIANEVQRRAMARMLTTGPFRDVYHFYNRYRVGTFSNPYYIVGAAVAVVGVLTAGGAVSCSGLAAAVWAALRY